MFIHISGVSAGDLFPDKKTIKVKLKAGHVLYADDRFVASERDTVIELPFNVDYYIRRKSSVRTDSFYSDLQSKAYRYRWTQELHNIILVPEGRKRNGDTVQTQKSEVPFLMYRNMTIRKIRINKLDVFGPTVYNPERTTTSAVGKFANRIHTKTHDYVLFQHLLFKSGDLIDPYTMADNERILRELPYIEDARIAVENINSDGDSADIVVYTKDNWSKGIDITSPDLKSYSIDVWDNNILGSGHEIDNRFFSNPDKQPTSGHMGYYRVSNIDGSFVNARIGYNAFGNKGYSIDVWRDFFTQRTKYAGQLKFEKNDSYARLRDSSFKYQYYKTQGEVSEIWAGRAFQIGKLSVRTTNINNLIIAGGIFRKYFELRPSVAEDYRYEFQNRTAYLASIALSSQGYYKTNLVYSFGRAEDIPFGVLLKYTHGIEVSEFSNRWYNGISLSHGKYVGNYGYAYKSIDFGGFLKNNKFDQGVLKLNGNYFTNLFMIGRFKSRTFINIGYTKGYQRNSDEYLTINDMSGIRGFVSDSIIGNQKFTFNFETVCFTPYYLAGFRFAAFVFADFGMVGKSDQLVFKYPLYSGFGVGLRFRNERLVFKTFQIRFAYYPKLPDRASGEFFNLTEESRYRPSNFKVKSPEVLRFK